MIICTKCGETLPDGTTFCPSCGTGTTTATTFEEADDNNTTTEPITNPPIVNQSSANGANFGNSIVAFITKIFVYNQKTSKTEFWFGALFYAIVMAVAGTLGSIPVIGYFTWIINVADCLALISCTVRRLNDIGFRWTRIFMYLIPIYGVIRFVLDMLMPADAMRK